MTFQVTYGDLKTIIKSGDVSIEIAEATHEVEDLTAGKISIKNKITGKYEMSNVAISDFVNGSSQSFASNFTEFGERIWNNEVSVDKIQNFTSKVQEIASGGDVTMPDVGTAGAPSAASLSVVGNVPYSEIEGISVTAAVIRILYPATVAAQQAPTVSFTSPLGNVDIEAGSDYSGSIQATGSLGDATQWSTNGATFIEDGVTTFTGPFLSPFLRSVNFTEVLTSKRVTLSLAHEAGPIPTDNYGAPAPSAQILAGTVEASFDVVPYWSTYTEEKDTGSEITLTGVGADNRTQVGAQAMTASKEPVLSFQNKTFSAGKTTVILLPFEVTTITAKRSGFEVNFGEITGPHPITNVAGNGTKDYWMVKFVGQALDVEIDTLTIS